VPATLESTGRASSRRAKQFARIDVAAVTAVRSVPEIRKDTPKDLIVHIHPVAKCIVGKDVERWIQNAHDYSEHDVRDVIEEPPPIREPCGIASQKAKSVG